MLSHCQLLKGLEKRRFLDRITSVNILLYCRQGKFFNDFRELAIQVKMEINSLKIKKEDDFDVVAVYGGSDIHEQIRRIREGCDIIVATPGRLIDLL